MIHFFFLYINYFIKILTKFPLYLQYRVIDLVIPQPMYINHNICPIILNFHILTITSTYISLDKHSIELSF